MSTYIPVPPDPWVPTATDSETKLFPTETMDALSEEFASAAQGVAADAALPAAQKGAPSGVAPLDAGSRVPQPNLPAHLDPAELSATIADAIASSPSAGTGIQRTAIVDVNKLVPGPFTATTWETPDGTGVLVHPSVLYIPGGVGGYKWWAAITPYYGTDNQVENPCILVSTDGSTWEEAPGVTNPLIGPPASGYNSDVELVQHPDGRLLLFYREFAPPTPYERIRLFQSVDGVTWTGPTTVLTSNEATRRLMSPAVWFDANAGEWVMIAVDIIPSTKPITRFTASAPEGPWTLTGTVATPTLYSGHKPWHLEARMVSGQVIMLLQSATSDGGAGLLYWATSEDSGATFTFATQPSSWGQNYRSSFVPTETERGLVLDTFAGYAYDGTWIVKRSQIIGGTAPERHDTDLIRAASLRGTYIFADNFARVAASLGTSPTGHVWTSSAGTWKTNGRSAYLDAATNTRSYVELGVADCTVRMLVGTVSGQCWLILRLTDANNYVRVGWDGSGAFRFQTIESGSAVTTTNIAYPPVNGPVEVEVTMLGSLYKVKINGFELPDITNTFNQTATKIGIQSSNTTVRVLSLIAQP